MLGRRCPKRGILLRVRKASWPLLLKWLAKPKLVLKHLKLKELMLKVKVRSYRKLLIVLKIQNLRRVRTKFLKRTAPCRNQQFLK